MASEYLRKLANIIGQSLTPTAAYQVLEERESTTAVIQKVEVEHHGEVLLAYIPFEGAESALESFRAVGVPSPSLDKQSPLESLSDPLVTDEQDEIKSYGGSE